MEEDGRSQVGHDRKVGKIDKGEQGSLKDLKIRTLCARFVNALGTYRRM